MSYSPKQVIYRYTVGDGADFTTLKAAVDYFNASATDDTEILLDGGHHPVDETIHIHSVGGYVLNLRGLDNSITIVEAATGLAGTPMFDIVTPCNFRLITCTGSSLAGYGDSAGEDCFNFATTVDLYSEISDIVIDTFYVGVNDTIGSSIFLYNFILDTCQTGVAVNYTTNSPTSPKPMIDAEIGNIEYCPVGIDLIHTGAAKKGNFFINNIIFKHNLSTMIGVQYDGTNYIYGEIAEIRGCTYNGTGELTSGFDFSLATARDANIKIVANTGAEDSKAHAKISLYAGATGTTITSANVYYKANFTNGSVYTTKMTITNNKMLYQPTSERDGMMWVSGSISVNQTNRNLGVCLRRGVPITSLIGGAAVATIVTPNSHNMTTGQQVQILGCASATYNGIKTITRVDNNTFTYPNTTNAGNVTGATTCGNLMGIVSVRSSTSGVAVPFSTNCYVEDMIQNGYTELYVTSANGGDSVTVVDLAWIFTTI